MNNLSFYFNEEVHGYVDSLDRRYSSTTTFLKKYSFFDTKKHATNSAIRLGISYEDVLKLWKNESIKGCDRGDKKHSVPEISINYATGYNKPTAVSDEYCRIHTITDVMNDRSYGKLDFDKFRTTELALKYPEIKHDIEYYCRQGFYIYSEILVYNVLKLKCGTIDVLLINWDTMEFIILDWKSNKSKISFISGYYRKDANRNLTDNFITLNETMLPPLTNLANCDGNKYSLQLGFYAYLTELFGFNPVLLRIYHFYFNRNLNTEELYKHDIKYLKKDLLKIL